MKKVWKTSDVQPILQKYFDDILKNLIDTEYIKDKTSVEKIDEIIKEK